MPSAAAQADQPAPRFSTEASEDALCPLLDAYRAALREASRPHGLLTVGTRRFVIEHTRRGTAALQREYCWRVADAGEDADAESARRRLESFEASLPPAPSPLMPLVLAIVVVVVAQMLGPLGAGVPSSGKLADEVSELQKFDVTQLGATVDALIHAPLRAVLFVVWAYALAAALVLWPLARGYRAARGTLGLGTDADRDTVDAEERRAFAGVGALPPPEREFDLWWRACGLAALAALAATFLLYVFTRDEPVTDVVIAVVLGAPVAWGAPRIRRELRLRRARASG